MKRLGALLRPALPALALITAFGLGAILLVLTDFEAPARMSSSRR